MGPTHSPTPDPIPIINLQVLFIHDVRHLTGDLEYLPSKCEGIDISTETHNGGAACREKGAGFGSPLTAPALRSQVGDHAPHQPTNCEDRSDHRKGEV